MKHHTKEASPGSDQRRFSCPTRILGVLSPAILVLLLAVGATPAFASGPPSVSSSNSAQSGYECPLTHSGGETKTSVPGFRGCVNPNDLETHWHFDYATSESGEWKEVPGDEGVISSVEAEEAAAGKRGKDEEVFSEAYPVVQQGNFRIHAGPLGGLSPETTYFYRLTAINGAGSASEIASFETELLRPSPEDITVFNVGSTSARAQVQVHPHGSETRWRYEYATDRKVLEEGHGSVGPEGTVSQVEAEAGASGGPSPEAEAGLTGLSPATVYYVRLSAENEPEPGVHKQATSDVASFETAGPPTVETFAVHALHGEAVRVLGAVQANTQLIDELQSVTVGGGATGGTFKLCLESECTGASDTGTLTSGSATVSFPLPVVKGTGNVFQPSNATNRYGGGEVADVIASVGQFLPGHPISGPGIPPGTQIGEVNGTTLVLSKPVSGSVSGAELISNGLLPPFAVGEVIAGAGIPASTTITGSSYANPDFTGTLTLSAKATATASGVAVTAELPFDASGEDVGQALSALPEVGGGSPVSGGGGRGGPYTVRFGGALTGVAEPLLTVDSSGLTPSGSVSVGMLEKGFSNDTHYHFEYVSQQQFEAGGFAGASSTREVDLGGQGGETVGADLPALVPGETYRFRLTASNTTVGDPVVHGEEDVLTAPAAPAVGPEVSCPNLQFRSGPSALLPDCRAYEQLTPHDKGGSIEPFRYGLELNEQGAQVGEDGDHVMLSEQFAHWESGTDGGQSPYFFARGGSGWKMTAATLQPQAGVDHYVPELESPDLTSFAFSAEWDTLGGVATESPDVEFKVGPPGGPYATAASVPRAERGSGGSTSKGGDGWVAASADFSKLILQVEDHRLIAGRSTGTAQGTDLYEYVGGELRQVNVTGLSPGVTIGTCGANIVRGNAESVDSSKSSRHAVSADGSRVFFEAVPGSSCSEPKHLFMRVNGAGTVDLGTGSFLAANAQGSEVLLEKNSGGAHEVVLYDTESAVAKVLFTFSEPLVGTLEVSEDFNVMYFSSRQRLTPEAPPPSAGGFAYLYRYDIATETLRFVLQTDALTNVSPDGRYVYGTGLVTGVPGGANFKSALSGSVEETQEAFLYDSTENVVECVSCASSFDPEPRWPANLGGGGEMTGGRPSANGTPSPTMFSANGDYAFFDTIAALLPQKVDGEFTEETAPEPPIDGKGGTNPYSPSSDVYEWRKAGVGGCASVQGCISLISSGQGGYLVLLLGTTESGSDVFFTTRSQLGPNDNDNSSDIYDARIDGGEPPLASRPVECEGDACSTPAGPPNDATPSSLTFTGAGNILQSAPRKPAVKSTKKAKPKKKRKAGKKQRKGRKAGKGRTAGNERGEATSRRSK
jgi:hypothetical protein